jgi:betaine-aldehyde dehydrogenase
MSEPRTERIELMQDDTVDGPLAQHWRAAAGDAAAIAAYDPALGRPRASYRAADDDEVDAAVRLAAQAFVSWSRTTPAERSGLLLRLADGLEAAGETFAQVECANVGRPLAMVRDEIAYDADVLRFMAGACRVPHGMGGGAFLEGSTSSVRRGPIGVVGLITPWNFPLMEAVWKVAPALAAGNTVVIKPSELTPESTILFVQLAQEVLPPGVLNLVLGDGGTGRALVAHPDVRLISLTGDPGTGRKVAEAAAATLKRLHLELGGKAPVLVFDDADVPAAAAELAALGFVNSGQDCTAPCRVIVHTAVHDVFVDAYCETVRSLRCGDPRDPATDVGPVVSARQLDRVAGFVDRARAGGATVRLGGRTREGAGYYYEPTVITGVEQGDEIVQREVFGPVVTIQRGDDDEQMLAMANGVPYGLAASVWTSDVDRALRCTDELAFGTVWVNQHMVLANEMPFGGFGQSGYGKELSSHAIDDYSQFKHVMMKTGR